MRPAPPEYDEGAAVGEVTVLVFALKPGQSEVRIRYPTDALPGNAGAGQKMDKFHALVMDELESAFGASRRKA